MEKLNKQEKEDQEEAIRLYSEHYSEVHIALLLNLKLQQVRQYLGDQEN